MRLRALKSLGLFLNTRVGRARSNSTGIVSLFRRYVFMRSQDAARAACQ